MLFSGAATNQSIEPVELSVDEVHTEEQPLEPLEGKDATLETIQRTEITDGSCIAEEFLLEYSCHNESKCDDENISVTLLEDRLGVSASVKKPSRSEVEFEDEVIASSPVNASSVRFSLSSPKPNLFLQSPYPNNFLSPTTQTPFRALAQSTPKSVFSENRDKVITTPSFTSSTGFTSNTGLNDRGVSTDHDTSLIRDTNVLTDLASPLCDKAHVQAAFGVTCHATEVNCKLEVSDVTFGSPSRSFELAMAREADKLCSGVERDSRTSGLGMLCLSIF